jgi:hypothetical protein
MDDGSSGLFDAAVFDRMHRAMFEHGLLAGAAAYYCNGNLVLSERDGGPRTIAFGFLEQGQQRKNPRFLGS